MKAIKHRQKKPEAAHIRASEKQRDFTLNAAGIAFTGVCVLFILTLELLQGRIPSLIELAIFVGVPLVTIVLMMFLPRWSAAVKLLILLCCCGAAAGGVLAGGVLGGAGLGEEIGKTEFRIVFLFAALAALAAPSIQKMEEWERAIVLRFGKFHRVRGPGLFVLIPLMDRTAQVVDIRIRVTDFAAQETLTRDSVTVTVDALCFWLVWDPEKAVCEVQQYEDAVILSSKTALRNAVSSHDLSTFLEHGEVIERQIQEEVDRKTTEWGITVQHIEITDIQIPEHLQDSLSRLAQAEREKKGRVLLAEAEIEIARKLEEAVQIYAKTEPAMKLKILSILNEGLKAGNSMMLVPSSITEELKSKDIFGLEALAELRSSSHKEQLLKQKKNAEGD